MADTTPATKTNTEWHLLDAKEQAVGRLATQAAGLLLGKHRPDAVPHGVLPIQVVIVNADEAVFSGAKEEAKRYSRYTGYPGGLRQRTVREQRQLDSRRLISDAVSGMLPKNKLRAIRMQQLKVYRGADHPHQAQL